MQQKNNFSARKALPLCSKNRQEIGFQLDKVVAAWFRVLSNARLRVAEKRWDKAVLFYSSAMKVSDITLAQRPHEGAISRYIRTTTEFIYSLRQCSCPTDLPLLIATVVEPITNMAFFPLPEMSQQLPHPEQES